MRYSEFVEAVRTRAALPDTGAARDAAEVVLGTVASHVPEATRNRLADALPGSLKAAADTGAAADPVSGEAFVQRVAERAGVPAERGRYLAQAVLSGLADTDPEPAGRVWAALPGDVQTVLVEAGEPPRRAASVAGDVPTELSDEDVHKALRGLTGWTGDRTGISRTVALPPDRLGPLIEQVQREAGRFNDRARVERDTESVTFTLRTGDEGVVTAPDVELAARIDEIVLSFGSGG